MKLFLLYGALLALSVACHDDTNHLLNRLDGRWQIHSLTYQGAAGPDSVVSLTNTPTYLTFESCALATNNSGPTGCRLEYRMGGQPYGFSYQAPNGKKSLYISPLTALHDPVYKQIAEQLSGSYEVVSLTDNSLLLRHALAVSLPGYRSVEYLATK